MLKISLSERLARAVDASPSGIARLDVLASLGLAGSGTLKVTIARLAKSGRIIRLKRGVYSSNPMRDAFACAQAVYDGYIGFSSALYLHGLIAELPFTVTVVTSGRSGSKRFGEYEFRAVCLKDKAFGSERKGGIVVSTRAKTLFDCLYLPEYSVEKEKLFSAFREARLGKKDWAEFDGYVSLVDSERKRASMLAAGKAIRKR